MSHWTALQWEIYQWLHIITGISYYAIPVSSALLIRFAKKHHHDFVVVTGGDILINATFIFACGTHHFAHAAWMFDHSKIEVLLVIDTSMAAISTVAAGRAVFRIFHILLPTIKAMITKVSDKVNKIWLRITLR